jgi:hypothetical protein
LKKNARLQRFEDGAFFFGYWFSAFTPKKGSKASGLEKHILHGKDFQDIPRQPLYYQQFTYQETLKSNKSKPIDFISEFLLLGNKIRPKSDANCYYALKLCHFFA